MCSKYKGLIETYKKYLPVSENTPVVSLLEGKTPLIESKNLALKIGLKNCKLYLKYDGLNPTGVKALGLVKLNAATSAQ